MAEKKEANIWILFEGIQVDCANFLPPNSHSEINTTSQVWVLGIV
jgi:hypothetical protein